MKSFGYELLPKSFAAIFSQLHPMAHVAEPRGVAASGVQLETYHRHSKSAAVAASADGVELLSQGGCCRSLHNMLILDTEC